MRRIHHLTFVCLLPSVKSFVSRSSFDFSVLPQTTVSLHHRRSHLRLQQSESLQDEPSSPLSASTDIATDADSTKNSDVLEQQQQKLVALLEETKRLQLELLETSVNDEASTSSLPLETLQKKVADLEAELKTYENALIPPVGLTLDEYTSACFVFLQLPLTARVALCHALGEEDAVAVSVKDIPRLVTRLHQEPLTPVQVQESMKVARSKQQSGTLQIQPTATTTNPVVQVGTTTTITSSSAATSSSTRKEDNGSKNDKPTGLSALFDGKAELTEEEMRLERSVEGLLPRVTRKEDRTATEQDLKNVLNAMPKDYFTVSSTQAILGGYVLRGSLRKDDPQVCLEAIQKTIPNDLQICVTRDFLSLEVFVTDPVLLLFRKDMSPTTNPIFAVASTMTAIASALVFAAGVYGANTDVMDQLSQADFSGIDFFNAKVLEILLPLGAIQISHDLGQAVVAKMNDMKTTTPVPLPLWTMPFMGTYTQLKESPKNVNSLLDFAMIGPLLGISASVGCLLAGLQMSATAPADVAQYFPALPVSVLHYSTLGGSLVDDLLGGTNGFYTLQDPKTAVSLHPLAIAGFSGLIIQCLDLLPLGCTNGGRMLLSLVGRQGHSIVSGFTWFVLLLCSLATEGADVLVAAWIVNNICQNDLELPCQNEVDNPTLPRVIGALSLYVVAFLVLTPLF